MSFAYPADRRLRTDLDFAPKGAEKVAAIDDDPEPVDLKRVLEARLESEGRLDKVGFKAKAFSGEVTRDEALEVAQTLDKLAEAMRQREEGDERFVDEFERVLLEKDAGAWDKLVGFFKKKEPSLAEKLFKGRSATETVQHLRDLQKIEAEKVKLDMLKALRQQAKQTPFGDEAAMAAAGQAGSGFLQSHPVAAGVLAGGVGAAGLRRLEGDK